MQRSAGMITVNQGRLDPEKARTLRFQAGFRFIAAAARAAGVNRKTVEMWEDPEGHIRPYLHTLQDFARAYGCNVEDFLTVPGSSDPIAPASAGEETA